MVKRCSVRSPRLATVAGELALRAELTMKIKSILTSTAELSQVPKPSSRFLWRRLLGFALGLTCLVLPMATVQAAAINLFWDPTTTGAPSDGSGTWHGGSTWWNGAADQAWAEGNLAVIGATTPGSLIR